MIDDLVDELAYGEMLIHVTCGQRTVIERESTWSSFKREYYCLHCREVIHIMYREMVRSTLEEVM
jgi:hypothetical protein